MAKKNENRTFCGTGRRKSSVAQVTMVPGKGKITINGKFDDLKFGGDFVVDNSEDVKNIAIYLSRIANQNLSISLQKKTI